MHQARHLVVSVTVVPILTKYYAECPGSHSSGGAIMKKPSVTCSHLIRLVTAVFSAFVLATFAVTADAAPGDPTARGDTYATPIGKTLTVQVSRVSGVLYNDFDTDPTTGEKIGNAGLTAMLDSGPTDPWHVEPERRRFVHLHAGRQPRATTTTTASPTRRRMPTATRRTWRP